MFIYSILFLPTGGALFRYLDRISKRVVVIISADLAHTHLSSGPYGYSDAAEPFDQVLFLRNKCWVGRLN